MNAQALPSTDRKTSSSAHLPAIDCNAKEQLGQSGYLALRDVTCVASDGVVTLHGRLPSYYLKQVAQEITLGVEGVRHVVNRIEVLAPAGRAPLARQTLAARSV